MKSPTITKAVIPLAGLGTRLFPASHAIQKELFPVVGPDGLARAMLHYHLNALHAAGFTDICLIVQPGGEDAILHYLRGPDAQTVARLAGNERLVEEMRQMRAFADALTFVHQREQLGYGHAVYQAALFAADRPVLLCLGDHLFRGTSSSPHRELADAAAYADGRSVSAVNAIRPDALKGYGVVAGTRRKGNARVIDVTRIIEKPDVETARAQLRVDGTPDDVFLGWFGMHLLAPSIFDILAEMIRDRVLDRGEFQLTRAQELQRQREGYLALEMNTAQRFDFGTPDDYLHAIQAFRQTSPS